MVRLLSWLADAFVLYLLIRLVLQLVAGGRAVLHRQRPASGGRGRTPERLGGTLVRDPNCGTYIPEARALRLRTGQETLYFCSPSCRDAYQHRT